jgi:Pentapeptide repeats (8 copies)
MIGAVQVEADLTSAFLDGADLLLADLDDAELDGADLASPDRPTPPRWAVSAVTRRGRLVGVGQRGGRCRARCRPRGAQGR